MKRQLGTMVGGAIAGVFVFNIWGILAGTEALGDAGGWLGGLLIVGFIWTVNHYVGAIYNPEGAVSVDMALAIGTAGTMQGVFGGDPISASLPTFLWVAVGAVLGGTFAAIVQKAIAEEE
ncbi:MAG: Lin0368 family putative glycerol transporter subunit [Bacillota bacterium]